MTQMYAVTSTRSVGATFLDWSIHWLTGADQFYNIERGWIKLSDSPLRANINSHGHQKNHPCGVDQCNEAVSLLKKVNRLVSLFPVYLHTEYVLSDLKIDKKDYASNKHLVEDAQKKDYSTIWNLLQEQKIPIVYLNFSDPLYLSVPRNLEVGMVDVAKSYNAKLDWFSEFFSIFFNNTISSLTPSEYREIIALNIRPFDHCELDQLVDFSKPHLYINAEHLMYDGLACVTKCIKFIGLTVDHSRINHWIKEYNKWQQIQLKILKFSWDFDHICDSIVNNYYHDLKEYELDIVQEATILHVLLYKHNLNIKAYGLDIFPNNTQDLYNLLEPNFHELGNVYNNISEQK